MKRIRTRFIDHLASASAPSGLVTRSKQLGGMMIESLVGLLILSLVGGGIMHATARMANTQHQQTMNSIAVNQMRAMVANRASATGADICSGAHTLTMPGQTSPVALTVKGCANTNMTVSNIQVSGAALANQTVTSARPVVLELGDGANLIRVGGSEVTNLAPN